MAQRTGVSEITPASSTTELTQDRPPRPYLVRPRPRPAAQAEARPPRGSEELELSIGWICFMCGFLLFIPWLAGFILSFISENKNDKRSRYWNLCFFIIVLLIYVIVWTAYN